MIEFTDLRKMEQGMLIDVLRVPALWPLQLLVGEVGLARALKACEDAELPAEAAEAFAACDYTAADLPVWEDAQWIVPAVRLKIARRYRQRRKAESLQASAARVGLTLREAQKALRILDRYGPTRPDQRRKKNALRS